MVLRDLAKWDKTFLQFLSTNKKPEKPISNSFSSLQSSGHRIVHGSGSPNSQKQTLIKLHDLINYEEDENGKVIIPLPQKSANRVIITDEDI